MSEKNNYYSDTIAKKFGIKWNEKEEKDENGDVIVTSRPKPTLPSQLSAPKQEDIDYNAAKANELAQKYGAKIPDNKTSRTTSVTLPTPKRTVESIKRSNNMAEGAGTSQYDGTNIRANQTMIGDDGQEYKVPITEKKSSNPVDFLFRNLATGTMKTVYDPLATRRYKP